MVYHGVVSKGCQRCRQRKVKRKPGCFKCEKSATQCPGYRNLNDVLFRDESRRTIQKSRQLEQSHNSVHEYLPFLVPAKSPQSLRPFTNITRPLSQPAHELGANFFFAKYTFNEPPFSRNYHDWLAQCYFEDPPNLALRAAIGAVGMAAISNIGDAPTIAAESNREYCRAAAAVGRALKDPVEAIADTTFMAVILLGLFERVNYETGERYDHWDAHIKGAIALLELRGPEQFLRERASLLYVHVRSQILLACVQQHAPVPATLVRITAGFHASAVREKWQRERVASGGSISEISFRLVNLRAAFKHGVADTAAIRYAAREIEGDLEIWRAGVHPSWRYSVVDARECYGGRRHVYLNMWIADVWNNWRTMRIIANQILLQNELRCSTPDEAQTAASLSIIQGFSEDLCISAASFAGSPRTLTLIRPLYVVALERLNERGVRLFAGEQLREIAASMGIRQAGLLAEMVAKRLDEVLDDVPRSMVALLPFGR